LVWSCVGCGGGVLGGVWGFWVFWVGGWFGVRGGGTLWFFFWGWGSLGWGGGGGPLGVLCGVGSFLLGGWWFVFFPFGWGGGLGGRVAAQPEGGLCWWVLRVGGVLFAGGGWPGGDGVGFGWWVSVLVGCRGVGVVGGLVGVVWDFWPVFLGVGGGVLFRVRRLLLLPTNSLPKWSVSSNLGPFVSPCPFPRRRARRGRCRFFPFFFCFFSSVLKRVRLPSPNYFFLKSIQVLPDSSSHCVPSPSPLRFSFKRSCSLCKWPVSQGEIYQFSERDLYSSSVPSSTCCFNAPSPNSFLLGILPPAKSPRFRFLSPQYVANFRFRSLIPTPVLGPSNQEPPPTSLARSPHFPPRHPPVPP